MGLGGWCRNGKSGKYSTQMSGMSRVGCTAYPWFQSCKIQLFCHSNHFKDRQLQQYWYCPLGSMLLGLYRLRLSVPLYGRHLRKWRTESRDWEQNKQKKWAEVSWNSTNTAHAHLCPICPQRFWLVRCKKHNRHAAPCIAPHRATHCTALRESPTHWSVVERDSAHVYYCAHF